LYIIAFQLTLNPNLFAKKPPSSSSSSSGEKLPESSNPPFPAENPPATPIKEDPDQEQLMVEEGASAGEGSGTGASSNYPQEAGDAEQSLMKMQLRKSLARMTELLSAILRVSLH